MEDLTGMLMDFESDLLDYQQTLELFDHLVQTGLAWKLQGFYGKQAADFIRQGLIPAEGVAA